MPQTTTTRSKKRTRHHGPDRKIELFDRNRIAWKDEHGTWQGVRGARTHLCDSAPRHLQLTAILQPDDSYLWVGVKGPGVEYGLCYGIVGAESLRALAREILRMEDNDRVGVR